MPTYALARNRLLLQTLPTVTSSPAAPSPPGGVTTNLLGWWEADQLALADGASVASWTDASVNARHAVQATGSAQPTYRATGGPNSKPCVEFDGGDELASPAFTPGNAAMTWYIVASAPGGVYGVFAELSTTINSTTTGAVVYREDVNSIANEMKGDVGYSTFTTTATLTTTPKLITSVFDKSLATNEVTAWVNSVSAGTRSNNDNNTNTFNGSHSLYLGRRNSGSASALTGKLTIVLLYAGAHDDTTRGIIEAAIIAKYAL